MLQSAICPVFGGIKLFPVVLSIITKHKTASYFDGFKKNSSSVNYSRDKSVSNETIERRQF